MHIVAELQTDDYRVGKEWEARIRHIEGKRVPLLWQVPPTRTCYARLHLLGLHLEEPVTLDPEPWFWWSKETEERYGRARSVEFVSRMPRSQDMTWIELYRVGNQCYMLIRWCIGGMLEGSDDYPIFSWGVARVPLSEAQARRLLWWQGDDAPRLIILPP